MAALKEIRDFVETYFGEHSNFVYHGEQDGVTYFTVFYWENSKRYEQRCSHSEGSYKPHGDRRQIYEMKA